MRCKQAKCGDVQTPSSSSAALSPPRSRDRLRAGAMAAAARQKQQPGSLGRAEAAAEELGRSLHSEFLHDSRAVELDRLDADRELLGDLAAGLAVEHALQHLPLPRREQLERRAGLGLL